MTFVKDAVSGFITYTRHRMSGTTLYTTWQLSLAEEFVRDLELCSPIENFLSPSAIKMIREVWIEKNLDFIFQIIGLEFILKGNDQLATILKSAIKFAIDGSPLSVGHVLNKMFKVTTDG